MRYTQNLLAIQTNSHVPEDDLDAIFSQLQQIEPPPPLLARIMKQIPQQAAQVSTECFFLPILRKSEINSWTTCSRQKSVC
jgi:hypothetical protein